MDSAGRNNIFWDMDSPCLGFISAQEGLGGMRGRFGMGILNANFKMLGAFVHHIMECPN